VNSTVPVIEVANDTDTLRVWRPHGKKYAFHFICAVGVSAEKVIRVPVFTLVKKMQVELFQLLRKAVGIVAAVLLPLMVAPGDTVSLWDLIGCAVPFKEISSFDPLQWLR